LLRTLPDSYTNAAVTRRAAAGQRDPGFDGQRRTGGDEHQPGRSPLIFSSSKGAGKVCLTLVLAGFQLAAAVTGSPWPSSAGAMGVQTARLGRCSPHGGVRPGARSITAAAWRYWEDGRHTGSGVTVAAPGAGARGW
jgi:hypothetical protein